MWYTRIAKAELSGWQPRLVAELGRKIYGEIYHNSKTAPEEEVDIYFNADKGEWLVSIGDWAETSEEVFVNAIRHAAKEMHENLDSEYKDPKIEVARECGSPGEDWIRVKHDF